MHCSIEVLCLYILTGVSLHRDEFVGPVIVLKINSRMKLSRGTPVQVLQRTFFSCKILFSCPFHRGEESLMCLQPREF